MQKPEYKESNPKIDICADGVYQSSTKWCTTCKQAIERFKEKHPSKKNVTARKDKES